MVRACDEKGELGKLVKLSEAGACGAESQHFIHVVCKQEIFACYGVAAAPEEEEEDGEELAAAASQGALKGCCPRCLFLRGMLHRGAAPPPPDPSEAAAKLRPKTEATGEATGEVKGEMKGGVEGGVKGETEVPMMCVNDEKGEPICDANGEPFGGFKPSTKLLRLRDLVHKIDAEDKVIIFSFFKAVRPCVLRRPRVGVQRLQSPRRCLDLSEQTPS